MEFVDFEDALTIAQMERQELIELYRDDEDFDKVDGADIERLEP